MSDLTARRNGHVPGGSSAPRLTLVDLASSRLTSADLVGFEPQTRAEARALMAARARLGDAPVPVPDVAVIEDTIALDLLAGPTRASRHAQRHGGSGRAVRVSRRAPRPSPESRAVWVGASDATVTRASLRQARRGKQSAARRVAAPKQAAAFLALAGALTAVQASASADPGTPTSTSAALSILPTDASAALALGEGVSRSGTRTTAAGSPASADSTAPQVDERATLRSDIAQAEADKRAADEAAAQAAAEAAAAAAIEAARWAQPADGPVTSPFGYRYNPISGAAELHTGIDFGGPCGSDVRASRPGTVVESGWTGGYGWRMVVSHGTIDGHDIQTTYSHLQARLAEVGASVERGQVIAALGTTGYSTGCHLHFEVKQDGTYVDPAPFLAR